MASSLEHQILRALRAVQPDGGPWIVAVSGGLDSVVLATVLARWRRLLRVRPILAYVHHGVDVPNAATPRRNLPERACAGESTSRQEVGVGRESTSGQEEAIGREFTSRQEVSSGPDLTSRREVIPPNSVPYRDRAQAFVRQLARANKTRFVTNRTPPPNLNSEATWRTFRYKCLHRWAREHKATHIVLAHHQDDLLETRLLRLIRGTGPAGLRAMQPKNNRLLRPLLEIPRATLEAYAREQNLIWVEDPSNQTVEPLRNWLRQAWLAPLSERQPGALTSLARSLRQILPQQQTSRLLSENVGVRRKLFSGLPREEQKALVAEYLSAMGARDLGASHVDEILKRLDTRRGTFTFTVRRCCFHVTPDLVWASRVCDRAASVLS